MAFLFFFNAYMVLNKISDIVYNPKQEMNDTIAELLWIKRYETNNIEKTVGTTQEPKTEFYTKKMPSDKK